MASKKAMISENVQNALQRMDWKAAIRELERMFRLDRDPHIRIRIGDLRRKLNTMNDAIREYLYAAELFAREGFSGKAAAQYALVLRLDASNEYARVKLEAIRADVPDTLYRREACEYIPPSLQERTDCSFWAA